MKSGSFQEALANTSEAKKRYTADDLYLRGSQLLATSYKQGVGSLRAFVEVDHVTKFQPLKSAIQLKKDFAHLLEVQICVFAQDPIFSTAHGEENRSLLLAGLKEFGEHIDVVGTTPYVENNFEASRRNIEWAVRTALRLKKCLDFHIEYNLNGGDVMETFSYLLDILITESWPTEPGAPTIVLGHATRLSQASHAQLSSFSKRIKEELLPVHFVALPTSDLFMMGRPEPDSKIPLNRVCGTMNIPRMIREYGFEGCLSVNNVGNSFTPYGTGDPLALASLGVGVFHAGTEDDARLLYEMVSTRAMEAIMPLKHSREKFALARESPLLNMLLIKNEEVFEIRAATGKPVKVPARLRLSVKDVIWDTPDLGSRTLIH
ncbi:hypothetical protein S40285_07804 [Stachybotrys chlorohalonatus IBT 40285]|uniref:Amidohydrolase-related domain-containing protein n=1 Tax=Stachybotrys chlorohalonatus (strain IBT 40285) TaxID=1283841 RepID=A0A084R2G0_STAC4|nr:hypothetical protein S40285_07804 [Stachybotrys chlorohalonata IBT 40285]